MAVSSGKQVLVGHAWYHLAMSDEGATRVQEIDNYILEDIYLVDRPTLLSRLEQ